jgi:hypothetical protein
MNLTIILQKEVTNLDEAKATIDKINTDELIKLDFKVTGQANEHITIPLEN